jgi:DUF4097 and DUF4098 domain-containing protein YvlB
MVTQLILSLCILLTAGQEIQQQTEPQEGPPDETPYIERGQRNFSFYPGGKIQINAGAPGSIKVIGWKRSSVLVEIERIIHGVDLEAAKVLSVKYPLQLRWTQTLGTITTVALPPGSVPMEMNLTLYVPKDKTDLKVQMSRGTFAVGSLNGWVEATLLNGSIMAKSVTGYFSATTKVGNIEAEMTGTRWEGYGFTAVTQMGDVELRLPQDYSAALQLETRNGNLKVDYTQTLPEGDPEPLVSAEKKNSRSLAGKLGTGGSQIRLMTMVGDIHFDKVEAP